MIEIKIPKGLKARLDPGTYELITKYNLAEDVLSYMPISQRKFWKEIAEATIGINAIRNRIPPHSIVWDVGTGMGFAAAGLAKARPDVTVVGIDKTRRKTWNILESYDLDNLLLIEANVLDYYQTSKENPNYILGIHNCKALSIIDIEIATAHNAGILLIPCCQDFTSLSKKLGFDIRHLLPPSIDRYSAWVVGLALLIKKLAPQYHVKISESKFLGGYTPKNMLIHAHPPQLNTKIQ